MGSTRTFLLEIGCEEIPAAALPQALDDLSRQLRETLGGLADRVDAAEPPPPFGSPRRLVAYLEGLREREEDRLTRVTGPPVSAAYDGQGRPTKAALGFAKAQGVPVEALERVRGEKGVKGEVVAAVRKQVGRVASEVLAETCPRVLGAMRFPKMMKWGDRGFAFVRPVHWIVALLDDEVVDFEFMGVRSGRHTRGHRFMAPGPHEIAGAREYEQILVKRGKVVVRTQDRARRIRDLREKAAAAKRWTVEEDEMLLDELVCLSEHPGVIAGSFPESLLALPEPVLITAMKHHQKYFPARAKGGVLAPGFLAVINLDGDPDGVIQRGNEWVLKARLADAQFFWKEDRRRPLDERVADLERVTFHEKLGSVLSRTRRLEKLTARLAADCGLPEAVAADARRAAQLCKADLTTGMVGEFPELQGVMGGIYAREEGLPEPVARAIETHYRPTSPAGPPPDTPTGCVLALADKVDLLAGCFAAALTPRGSADPYGLRRAALGACRILLSESMERLPGVGLDGLVEEALGLYAAQGIAAQDGARRSLLEFVQQRLRFLMEEGGMRFDTARAALAAGADDLRDAWRRAASLTALRVPGHEADFDALATSAKRIRNILAQAREKGIDPVSLTLEPSRLVDGEEKELYEAVAGAAAWVERETAAGDYEAALRRIASVRPQVDRFFDKVLVMTPDESLRRNRLALLAFLSSLLSRVADFSEIVVEGESQVRVA